MRNPVFLVPWLVGSALVGSLGCGHGGSSPGTYHPPDFSVGGAPDLGSPPEPVDAAQPDAPPPSADDPLGATVVAGGVHFRVWAPDADGVSVVGSWNAQAGDPLASDGPGTFGAVIAAAQVGQSYAFAITTAGSTVTRPDPRARAVAADGTSVIVDPRFAWAPFSLPPVEQRVMYELHIGTFNVGAGGIPSTFAEAAQKLDWVAQLGVNVVEIMPPAQFPGAHSWGYNPSLPFAAATVYGTPDDLRRFVDAAHARGIGVVVDVVHNHYSSKTPLWCYDGDCLGAGGAYFYTDARRTTPWGPRPDFGDPEVKSYILDNARLWLGEYRADGMRWDSVVNIRQANNVDNPDGQSLLRALNDAIAAEHPGTIQVAEDLQTYDPITAPTASGGYGFTTQWDAAFFHPVDDTIIAAADSSRSMPTVAGAITHAYNGDPWQRVIYTEDHDEVANGKARIPQMIDATDPSSYAARKRSTLGAAVVLTSPGVPMLFMGQEFLESGSFSDTNPLDWSKATTFAPIVQLYKDLIRLRRNLDGNTAGLTGTHVSVFHVNDGAKVLAWRRWSAGGDDVIVLANFSQTAFQQYQLGLPAGGTWHVRFSSDAKIYSSDFGDVGLGDVTATATARDGLPYEATFALAPYSVVIASQ